MAYYPFLHNTTKKKTEIPLDSDVLNSKFIQSNQDSELQEVSKELIFSNKKPKNSECPVMLTFPTCRQSKKKFQVIIMGHRDSPSRGAGMTQW